MILYHYPHAEVPLSISIYLYIYIYIYIYNYIMWMIMQQPAAWNKYFELKNSWGANVAPQTQTTC